MFVDLGLRDSGIRAGKTLNDFVYELKYSENLGKIILKVKLLLAVRARV